MIRGLLSFISAILLFPLNAQDFNWVQAIGGDGFDDVEDITTDSEGNVYVAGKFTRPTDFDPSEGVSELSTENSDGFVLKLDADGAFLWVQHLDGSTGSENLPAAIQLDQDGNVLVAGEFTDQSDFNTTGGGSVLSAGARDAYLAKYSTSGEFLWVNQLAGGIETKILSVTVDQNNDYYTTGFFRGSVDFDPGVNEMILSAGGSDDIFLQKLNADGDLIWVKQFGSSDNEQGQFVKAHGEHLYWTGYYKNSIDFDSGAGEAVLTSRDGSSDAFIQKMNLNGDHIWVRSFGGESIDEGIVIEIDSKENVILGGDYLSMVYFSDDNSISFPNIIGAGFLIKLTPEGELSWVVAAREHEDLALDAEDNIYIIGDYRKPFDFDPSENELILEGPERGSNGIIQKFDTDGSHVWIKVIEKLSGTGATELLSIHIDEASQILVTGSFWETLDFDPGDGREEITSAKFSDGFVLKLSAETTAAHDLNDISSTVKVFPNPFQDQLTLEAQHQLVAPKVVLYDQVGRKIHTISPAGLLGHEKITLPTSLPPGMYFLQVRDGFNQAQIKLIKAKM